MCTASTIRPPAWRPRRREGLWAGESPMSTIVSCECGVKVRLPELSSGQAFCCPKCKANLLVGADMAVDGEPRIRASDLAQGADVGRTCPICQSPIAAE